LCVTCADVMVDGERPASVNGACPHCGQPVLGRQLEENQGQQVSGERLLAYLTSDAFRKRMRSVLHAVDDLRHLQAEERKRYEALWGAQEEALSGIEKLAGHIQGQVRAMVEGRDRC